MSDIENSNHNDSEVKESNDNISSENEEKNLPEKSPWYGKWQVLAAFLMIYDIAAIHTAYLVALWGRFDFAFSTIPDAFLDPYKKFITIYSFVCIIIFWLFRLYKSMWRFAGYDELVRIMEASALTSLLHCILITVLCGRMPLTYYFFGSLLQFIFLMIVRFAYRFFLHGRAHHRMNDANAGRVMLIGAGAAGQSIIREIVNARETNDKVVCIIDDDSNKWNRYVEGVPIVGGRDDILLNVSKYNVNKIFLAIPSASLEEKRDILNICGSTNCELKQLPGIYQLVTGEVSVSAMKEVSVEDLLGRDPIKPDMSGVFAAIHDKTVLVTGGGGSIGSELCRQIAGHEPKKLIIFDVYENNAYDIQLELREKYPELNLTVLIGSVRDSRRMFQVFDEYSPDIYQHIY